MTALVTLSDYKLYKKLTKTENDNELGFIISSVSQLVKGYCGHSFIDYYSTPITETFSISKCQNAVLLNEWPVKEIVSVSYRDEATGAYIELDSSEYYLDKAIDTVYKFKNYWPEGVGALKVEYLAGYSQTPPDVKIACLDLVHHYFKEEYKERKSIGSISIDTGTQSEWPLHITRVLDLYKNG